MSDSKQLDLFTAQVGDQTIAVRDHGPEMSMAQFESWLEGNLGSSKLRNALKQAAFLLCCDVIAQDISKATLELREKLPNGTSRVVKPGEHQIADLLALEPNRWHTWNEFSEMMMLWDCYTSNAYAGVYRNRFNEPVELIPFQSPRVTSLVEGRDFFYDVTAGTMAEQAMLGQGYKRFPERDFIHVRARMVDGVNGMSTLEVGTNVLDAGSSIDDFRHSLFAEEGQLRGVFSKSDPAPLDDIMFQRLRMQLKELMTRWKRDATLPLVLEGGMTFQAISSKPMEMEVTKQFSDQVNQVCRLLRVPPHKVFQMDGTKYENLETMEKAYVGDTLVPRAERHEHRFAKTLLSKKDRLRLFFQYNRDEMSLHDSQRTTERMKMLLQQGASTFDEARAAFDLTEMPNGQGKMRTIPSNMNVVDETGKVVIPASAGGGLGGDNPASGDKSPQGPKKDVRLVVNNSGG